MEAYERNKQVKGMQQEVGGMVESGIKTFILGELTMGVGGVSPLLATTLNTVITTGMGKDGYNNVRDGLKEGDSAKITQGITSIAMALMASKDLAKGVKNGTVTKIVTDKYNIGPKIQVGKTPEQVKTKAVQQILQDKSTKIETLNRNQAAAEQAVNDVDLKKTKTYKEANQKTQAAKRSVYKALDDIAQTDKTTYKPSDLTKEVGTAKIDHVSDALGDLKETFKNDPAKMQKYEALESKYKTSGLTAKEINDIAIDHGQAKPAWNQNTGAILKSKGSIETTRQGVKQTFRELFPEETSKTLTDLDRRYSNLRILEDRLARQEAKVYKAKASAKEQNIIEKIS